MIAIPCQNILDIISCSFSTKTVHVFNLVEQSNNNEFNEISEKIRALKYEDI